MQVTHTHDHVTHAIIGGSQKQEMGIASNAAFYNMLSTALYPNPKLAVVREVICNAWDAHIASGLVDTPIEITLMDNMLSIKDFGTGIHKDLIQPIYGIYGGSTKTNDGLQTGGFGLGCKAPFSYTDNFEVISSHEGIKTVYRMSKASGDSGGKPSITAIVSTPTTETGITVRISIKPSDVLEFRGNIKKVVLYGDIKANYNNQLLKTIGLSTEDDSFVVFDDEESAFSFRISVRYGNVIYPVTPHTELNGLVSEASEVINKVRAQSYYQNRLILQAPPNSIAVTPSRETLSMQEHTVKTVKILLQNFIANNTKASKVSATAMISKAVQSLVDAKKTASLLNRKLHSAVREHAELQLAATKPKRTVEDLAKARLYINYPMQVDVAKRDMLNRVSKLMAEGLVDRGLAQSYVRELKTTDIGKPTVSQRHVERNSWLMRRVVKPLITKIGAMEDMDVKRLYILDKDVVPILYKHSYAPVPARCALTKHVFNHIEYLVRNVVITQAMSNIEERIHEHYKTVPNGLLIYHVGMKKAEKEAARAFFSNPMYKVVDLITEPVRRTTPKAPSKPRKKGVPMLLSAYNKGCLNKKAFEEETLACIEEPEFTVCLANATTVSDFEVYSSDQTTFIINTWGDKCGMLRTKAQQTSWANSKQIPSMKAFVQDKVKDYFLNSPVAKAQWAMSSHAAAKFIVNYQLRNSLSILLRTPDLLSALGVAITPDPYHKAMLSLLNRSRTSSDSACRYETNKIIEELEKIDLHPSLKKLCEKLTNPMLEILDSNTIMQKLNSVHTPKDEKAAIITTVTSIINT